MDDFDVLIENLATLMKHNGIESQSQLQRLSGVSQGHISNIMRREKTPSLEVIEKLARTFKLQSWQLLAPNLAYSNPESPESARLLHYYASATPQARNVILQVAQAQSGADPLEGVTFE